MLNVFVWPAPQWYCTGVVITDLEQRDLEIIDILTGLSFGLSPGNCEYSASLFLSLTEDEHNSPNPTFYPVKLFVRNLKWAIQICTIFATEIFFLIAGEILLPHTSSVPTLTRIWKYSGLKDFNAQNSEGEKLYDINTGILILQHRHQMTPELIWRWNLRPLVSNLEKTTNYHHHHLTALYQRPASHNSWWYQSLKLSILFLNYSSFSPQFHLEDTLTAYKESSVGVGLSFFAVRGKFLTKKWFDIFKDWLQLGWTLRQQISDYTQTLLYYNSHKRMSLTENSSDTYHQRIDETLYLTDCPSSRLITFSKFNIFIY